MDKDINLEFIIQTIEKTLQDRKAEDIIVLPIGHMTSIAEYMIIATGTSNRHLTALYEYIREALKTVVKIARPMNTGLTWISIDLESVIVHLMTQESRDYYRLESLWKYNQTD